MLYALLQLFILIAVIAIYARQEKLMSDIDTLTDKVTALESDEASIAADLAVLIAELKPLPIPQAIFDRLDALHAKLQGDDATVKNAETPAPVVTDTPAV